VGHVTADTRTLLSTLLDSATVVSTEGLTAPGRSGAFSDLTVADVRLADREMRVVVRTGSPVGPFHHPEDAVRHLLWYSRVAQLPGHPRVLAVGAKDGGGEWRRLVGTPTVAVVEEFAPGVPYARDLVEVRRRRGLTRRDRRRAALLGRYLASIHQSRRPDAVAYLRGLRELVGGPEGIMSVISLYPDEFRVEQRHLLCQLQSAVAERAFELEYADRPVATVHGDFHPGNILFTDDDELAVVDRGRIERDEVAVDVGAALINFVALGLAEPELREPATTLAQIFISEYLSATGDAEMATALPAHTAMRAAAVASPTFYPELCHRTRIAILSAGITIANEPTLGLDNLEACFEPAKEIL
jgi:aminoglycoside phosphotransferase (APT) family kinase protein